MQESESVVCLERLADAFVTLAAAAPELMVDRDTRAPAAAIGWLAARNFRVRLRPDPAAGQASAYYRVGGAGLELMIVASRADAGPTTEDGAAQGAWSSVSVPPGEEPSSANLILEQLRRRML